MSRTALIDGDMLRYTLGFACQEEDEEGVITTAPTFSWQHSVDVFISAVVKNSGSQGFPKVYLTGEGNFREEIAQRRPYKEDRKDAEKPVLYEAIGSYLVDEWAAIVVNGMEADDALAIEQTNSLAYSCIEGTDDYVLDPEFCDTIICTLDKDLRQVEGWHYSWPVGDHIGEREPYFVYPMGELIPLFHKTDTVKVFETWPLVNGEPVDPTQDFYLIPFDTYTRGAKKGEVKTKRVQVGTTPKFKKLEGTGISFFYAQILMGDPTDSIPGLEGVGDKGAYLALRGATSELDMFNRCYALYSGRYAEMGYMELQEQARLLWMVRELDEMGDPVMWSAPRGAFDAE